MATHPSRPTLRNLAIGATLGLVTALIPQVATAPSADAATFNAGMIISDDVFYNAGAMDATSIQAFLNSANPNCVPGATPCLKSYRQTTFARAGDSRCPNSYTGASNESAATIIAKVAVACQVNPQVLLVLLQKEQSLVTASGSALTASRYRSATGYGCPDTAPCDAQYYGFYNQVYKAAWQFRAYRANPYGYAHVAGRTNQIRINPNAACGTASVYISNQATAGLYNYTPYTPNSALLNGRPDGCSSYGNYNFFTYFVKWFGSTSYTTGGGIGTLWRANMALLGAPTSNERPGLRNGGVVQNFQNGSVYWTPALGPHIVRGAIGTYWGWQRWENSAYGYPTTNERALGGGASVQSFEQGVIYWTPSTGPHGIRGGILTWFNAHRWESYSGFPTSDERALARGGVVQNFQRLAIYWTPSTGSHGVNGAILNLWGSQGWENGRLGYPVTDPYLVGRDTVQIFEHGRITASGTTGRLTITYS